MTCPLRGFPALLDILRARWTRESSICSDKRSLYRKMSAMLGCANSWNQTPRPSPDSEKLRRIHPTIRSGWWVSSFHSVDAAEHRSKKRMKRTLVWVVSQKPRVWVRAAFCEKRREPAQRANPRS